MSLWLWPRIRSATIASAPCCDTVPIPFMEQHYRSKLSGWVVSRNLLGQKHFLNVQRLKLTFLYPFSCRNQQMHNCKDVQPYSFLHYTDMFQSLLWLSSGCGTIRIQVIHYRLHKMPEKNVPRFLPIYSSEHTIVKYHKMFYKILYFSIGCLLESFDK
jgi:hypothetical protein